MMTPGGSQMSQRLLLLSPDKGSPEEYSPGGKNKINSRLLLQQNERRRAVRSELQASSSRSGRRHDCIVLLKSSRGVV